MALLEMKATEPEAFRAQVRDALKRQCGRRDLAAKELRIPARTLARWLQVDPTLADGIGLHKGRGPKKKSKRSKANKKNSGSR